MSNTESPSGLITASEVADRLGVHVESVRRWTREGKLAAVRLPSGRCRYRAEDLASLVGPSRSASDVEALAAESSRAAS